MITVCITVGEVHGNSVYSKAKYKFIYLHRQNKYISIPRVLGMMLE